MPLHTDGVLIAAYLNAWEIAQTLLTDAPQWFADARKVDYLLAGEEFVGARTCSGFTECHWSTPDDARTEIAEAGFPVLKVAGAEGFACGVRNEVAVNARDNPALFEQIVIFGVQTSRLPQCRRATDHFLVVGNV